MKSSLSEKGSCTDPKKKENKISAHKQRPTKEGTKEGNGNLLASEPARGARNLHMKRGTKKTRKGRTYATKELRKNGTAMKTKGEEGQSQMKPLKDRMEGFPRKGQKGEGQ